MNTEQKHWEVKREISLGDLVAVAVALVSVIVTYMNLDARVRIVELVSSQNTQQINTTVSEIKSDMRRLADRVEKIVDNHNGDMSLFKKGK